MGLTSKVQILGDCTGERLLTKTDKENMAEDPLTAVGFEKEYMYVYNWKKICITVLGVMSLNCTL